MTSSRTLSLPTSRLDLVLTPDQALPLDHLPEARISAGLEDLIAQETQHRRESHNEAIAAALAGLGFSWESLSEPGHMRAVGPAAVLLRQAEAHAVRRAHRILAALDIPCLELAGVSLVDAGSPRLRGYLAMINGGDDLYGSAYQVDSDGAPYVLRQTSCFQKYAACLDRPIAGAALPVALFEVSDSFRREPVETLQLCGRLRRFRLPEAHVHTPTVADAVAVSIDIHRQLMVLLSELSAEVVLLVNCTHDFMARHPDFASRLVELGHVSALVRIAGPGEKCMDGVEVDVEYKVVDSAGCCRELATFQIDEAITASFGVAMEDNSAPATIHLAASGSVERFTYLEVDAAHGRRGLPGWLAPVQVRIVPAAPGWHEPARGLARRLSGEGFRVDLDDRYLAPESMIADADSLLIPLVIRVDGGSVEAPEVSVRECRSGAFRPARHLDVLGELSLHSDGLGADVPLLSRHRFGVSAACQPAGV